MRYLIKIKEAILDILFPALCLNCRTALPRESGRILCGQCQEKIQFNTTLFCPVCRLRLADNKKVCHKDSKYLLAAATNYDNEVIRNLIHFFKYQKWSNLKNFLGEILIKYLDSIPLTPGSETCVVIPIPLSQDRLRERGFNQSLLLAKIVADRYRLDLTDNVLKRIKETKSQSGLKDWEERKENVKNCFALENPELINGKNIILVDDVYTSGATMNEAATILRSHGAKKIIAVVVAKAR